MTARELRQKYLQFFESKGHTIFPSGSLVPFDVTGKLDESLLFNGAGMVQFKPYFRGIAEPPNRRLTTAQKCVRTGDIECVGDTSHLTFFEMLGNFSFGDYFKKQAIDYSWEFLTYPKWLGLDPKRLSFTVFEEDDEAYEAWSVHFRSVGIDPTSRIIRLGEETNYWPAGSFSNGPPGPCGPNSEMFYWTRDDEEPPGAGYTRENWERDDAAGKWLEIWNDVFIQYEWKGRLRNPERPNEGFEKEAMDHLPFNSVDTGMGLERTVVVLNGMSSVYDTDVFEPIIARIEEISGGRTTYGNSDETDVAIRIIADHIRTACFCIADGVLPANNGRGYVLRRLIRRAVLKGSRVLGFHEPFFHRVYDGVVTAVGDHYAELIERREVIVETLGNEEALFRRTLKSGEQELEDQGFYRIFNMLLEIARRKKEGIDDPELAELLRSMPDSTGVQWILHDLETVPKAFDRFSQTGRLKEIFKMLTQLTGKTLILDGALAFKLYDTYGFPLEVTMELCEEAGVTVDIEGYEKALEEAQERSRGASGMDNVYASQGEALVLAASKNAKTHSTFVGYDCLEHATEIVQISPRFGSDGLTTGEFQICLDETPFYAESGGQVGDTGTIEGKQFKFEVTQTWKEMGLIWHDAKLVDLGPNAVVPTGREGSPLSGVSQGEISDLLHSGFFFQPVFAHVDAGRRKSITRNHSATHLLHAALRQVLGKHVTQAGSLVAPDHLRFDFTHGKAMTPEEIAEVERIVNEESLRSVPVTLHADISINEAKQRGAMALFGEKYGDRVRMVEMGPFSLELCGGCHVRQTSEIGLFKILSESSAASGVRRIEAITGEKAYDWVREQNERVKEAAKLLKSSPSDLIHAVERMVEQLREERKRLERMRSQAATTSSADTVAVGSVELAREKLTEGDVKEATLVADRLAEGQASRVALVGLAADGKVTFICKVGADAQKAGAHAGNLVREIAKIAGGGGGGRPDFATAGGRDASKLDEALKAAEELLKAQVGG